MGKKTTVAASVALAAIMSLTGVLLNACAAVTTSTASPSASSAVSTLPSAAASSETTSPALSPSSAPSAAPSTVPTVLPSQTGASASAGTSQSVIYKNTQYGFDFSLPKDWIGYTIVSEEWKGTLLTDSQQPGPTGPEILIRNPKWTKANPMQDIPVMVFTLGQWTAVQNEEFAVSAAPIPPSELGRNSKYVFALPARYNFAFLTGYEEVDQILQGNPLQTNENFK